MLFLMIVMVMLMELFDVPKEGIVTSGYYQNTSHEFLWSVKNDLGVWYFSKTFNTWFKFTEIEFIS